MVFSLLMQFKSDKERGPVMSSQHPCIIKTSDQEGRPEAFHFYKHMLAPNSRQGHPEIPRTKSDKRKGEKIYHKRKG